MIIMIVIIAMMSKNMCFWDSKYVRDKSRFKVVDMCI